MFGLLAALKSDISLRIKKQKQRRKIFITPEFYIETFNYPSGTVMLCALFGGEMDWSIELDVPDARRLLIGLAAAFEYTPTVTSVVTARAEFYIKTQTKGVVLEVFLHDLFQTVSRSISISQPQTEETARDFLNLQDTTGEDASGCRDGSSIKEAVDTSSTSSTMIGRAPRDRGRLGFFKFSISAGAGLVVIWKSTDLTHRFLSGTFDRNLLNAISISLGFCTTFILDVILDRTLGGDR